MVEFSGDFEFERRFFVSTFPNHLFEVEDHADTSRLSSNRVEAGKPDVIVQTYFLAKEGYGLRVRLQATQPDVELPLDIDGKEAIQYFLPHFDLCMLTVKGPAAGGTRYEAERPLDIGVGAQMSMLGGLTLAKRRWAIWLHADGWNIDQFAGDNFPLVVAECERTSPVTDLVIPSFCTQEITDDTRFSNDELVNHPFSEWAGEYLASLSLSAPPFKEGFGENRHSRY